MPNRFANPTDAVLQHKITQQLIAVLSRSIWKNSIHVRCMFFFSFFHFLHTQSQDGYPQGFLPAQSGKSDGSSAVEDRRVVSAAVAAADDVVVTPSF